MDALIPIGKQLEILYGSGADLSLEFATEQSELCELRDKEKPEGERQAPGMKESGRKEKAVKEVDFEGRYQRWYSIALPLMKQAAPDRYVEFQTYYLPDPKRERVDGYNYVIQDWMRHEAVEEETGVEPWMATGRCFLNQLAILKSIKDRLEWQATVTPDQAGRSLQLAALETARDLLKISERAAGALAGTVLQTFLAALAQKHKLKFRKHAPSSRDYAEALKTANVLDVPVWSQCTWLAEIHERCLRPEGEAPTKPQVRDLIDGTHWLITNIF